MPAAGPFRAPGAVWPSGRARPHAGRAPACSSRRSSELPLVTAKWLVLAVVVYTALAMLRPKTVTHEGGRNGEPAVRDQVGRRCAPTPEGHGLKRTLGAMDLVLLGIGAIIGAGIFVLTGRAAADYAGPAVALSFVVAGIACGFAGLCYAEMASMIPIAGSAYTYSYATMGELVAWIIGWDLILEYLVAAAAVASAGPATSAAFVDDVPGHPLPTALDDAPLG